MLCSSCQLDVHPVQEMTANGAGFVSKCPTEGCGAAMERPPVNTVSSSIESEITALKDDVAFLESLTERTDEQAQALFETKKRLHRLLNPVAYVPKATVVPVKLMTPAVQAAQATSVAPIGVGDIFDSLRARLNQLDAERRKILAVLAVADTIT